MMKLKSTLLIALICYACQESDQYHPENELKNLVEYQEDQTQLIARHLDEINQNPSLYQMIDLRTDPEAMAKINRDDRELLIICEDEEISKEIVLQLLKQGFKASYLK